VIVSFLDIGGIIDHYYLNFHLIMSYTWLNIIQIRCLTLN